MHFFLSLLLPFVAALKRLRGRFTNLIQEDEAILESEARNSSSIGSLSLWQLLKTRRLWRAVIIGIGLQLSQQLSGINIAFYFSSSIFKEAKVNNGDVATVIVGAVGMNKMLGVCL